MQIAATKLEEATKLERAAHASAAGAAEARNQSECALIVLLREYDAGCENAVLVMRSLSIRSLWLLRRVSRDCRRWGTAALSGRPRPLVLGGAKATCPTETYGDSMFADSEALNLHTMR